MTKHSIESNRPADEAFAYLDQVGGHNEWQGSLVSTTVETDGPTRVGTGVVERRNVSRGTRAILARRQAAKQVPVDHEKLERAARKRRRGDGFEVTPQ
jgi:hypothetical protein